MKYKIFNITILFLIAGEISLKICNSSNTLKSKDLINQVIYHLCCKNKVKKYDVHYRNLELSRVPRPFQVYLALLPYNFMIYIQSRWKNYFSHFTLIKINVNAQMQN